MNNYTNNLEHHSSGLQDNVILEHYGLNELNFESVKHYREKFAEAKPNHPWNGLEMKEFLYKIGAWGKLRNSSKEGITIAGLLMFSEERIITEVLPQYFLEYREIQTTYQGGWSKRFTSQDGTWSGNVYDFYFKVMDTISPYERSIAPALHEAVINALVHADYFGEGGIVIEQERNIYRISNPGLLRIPVESAWTSGMSHLRNPNVFKMFILIGLCKRAGFGLPYLSSVWKGHHWKQPEIIQQADPARTIVVLPTEPSAVMFPEETAVTSETEEQLLVIQHGEEEFVDWGEELAADFINNTPNSVSKNSNSLNNGNNSINNIPDSLNNALYSINNNINSVNNRENSVNKTSDSVNNYSKSVNNKSGEEKIDVEDSLWQIASLARKKRRLPPAMMEQIILQLCAKRPLMLKELSYLLDRTADGLRNNYLAKLLEEGKVRLKYPEQPNHPRQAYMTIQDS